MRLHPQADCSNYAETGLLGASKKHEINDFISSTRHWIVMLQCEK